MQLHVIETGHFKLDGGVMFGVVPKVLWQRTHAADVYNLVSLTARCLLIANEDRLILIDTGLGNKQSAKFFSHYHLFGNHSLEKSIKQAGYSLDDITDVFLTHLHFDHVGGATSINHKSQVVPTFKKATYWVHQDQWNWAIYPNPREKASFLPENLHPLLDSQQLKFIENDAESLQRAKFPFDVLFFDGHTEKQMLPKITYKNKSIVFAGDLIPTYAHIPIPYLMGYDVRPLVTMREKTIFLNSAVDQGFLLFMEHDIQHELISLKQTPKGVRIDESMMLSELF
ncbi:MAG: MBL fold metallo-hydrolase [Flavobacteriaceae bacterium]|nr:MBL fold metallo-hydrolase [Flavobacteriaceae bacterium]